LELASSEVFVRRVCHEEGSPILKNPNIDTAKPTNKSAKVDITHGFCIAIWMLPPNSPAKTPAMV
jgi:hypothetical protein